MNKEEQIKFACKHLIEQRELEVISIIFSTGYIVHAGDKRYSGHKFIKRFAGQIWSAIPDIKVLRIEFLTQTDNIIAWQRTFRGTHKANMMGIPPSGKKIKWTDMVITRFEDERIAEEWVVSDLAGQLLLKQPIKKNKTKP